MAQVTAQVVRRNQFDEKTAACHDHVMIANVEAASRSLHGLALGDAFGETWFFRPAERMQGQIAERLVPPGPWPWTDDTAMAISLYQTLREHGRVIQDDLADRFAIAAGIVAARTGLDGVPGEWLNAREPLPTL